MKKLDNREKADIIIFGLLVLGIYTVVSFVFRCISYILT